MGTPATSSGLQGCPEEATDPNFVALCRAIDCLRSFVPIAASPPLFTKGADPDEMDFAFDALLASARPPPGLDLPTVAGLVLQCLSGLHRPLLPAPESREMLGAILCSDSLADIHIEGKLEQLPAPQKPVLLALLRLMALLDAYSHEACPRAKLAAALAGPLLLAPCGGDPGCLTQFSAAEVEAAACQVAALLLDSDVILFGGEPPELCVLEREQQALREGALPSLCDEAIAAAKGQTLPLPPPQQEVAAPAQLASSAGSYPSASLGTPQLAQQGPREQPAVARQQAAAAAGLGQQEQIADAETLPRVPEEKIRELRVALAVEREHREAAEAALAAERARRTKMKSRCEGMQRSVAELAAQVEALSRQIAEK